MATLDVNWDDLINSLNSHRKNDNSFSRNDLKNVIKEGVTEAKKSETTKSKDNDADILKSLLQKYNFKPDAFEKLSKAVDSFTKGLTPLSEALKVFNKYPVLKKDLENIYTAKSLGVGGAKKAEKVATIKYDEEIKRSIMEAIKPLREEFEKAKTNAETTKEEKDAAKNTRIKTEQEAKTQAAENKKMLDKIKLEQEKIREEIKTLSEKKKADIGEQKDIWGLKGVIAAARKEDRQFKRAEIQLENAEEAKERSKARKARNLGNARESMDIYTRFNDILNGRINGDPNYRLSSSLQSLEVASKSALKGMHNVYAYVGSEGKIGNAQLAQTALTRVDAYVRLVQQVAEEWKKSNSEEAKQLELLKGNIKSVEDFAGRISRVKTAFGQLSSALGAIRSVGQTIYKSVVQPILRAVTQTVSQLTSTAFNSSLDALKQLELSEIGFSNFYGAENVQAILRDVKQNALLSPLGAPQLANYVNQLAPISGGNSTLALNAAMGAAKMIQYSGGEVQSEMEYVIKNIRDVYAKNTATALDIRQFNRAMPALERALQSVGAEQFLKTEDGSTVLKIDKTNARQILKAFEMISNSEDVGKIFEQTSETLSGLFERVEEQVQLMVIDVADFADATRWIKQTISDLLDDTDGKIADIKMSLSFIFEDIFDWLKSRDWQDIAETLGNILKDMFDTFKTAINELREAFAGMNWKQTLKDLVNLFTSFLTGMIKSYTWLAEAYRSIGGWFGTGAANSVFSGLGFMSAAPAQFLTGGTRAIGNIYGLLDSGINMFSASLKKESAALEVVIGQTLTFAQALSIATQLAPNLAADATQMKRTMAAIQGLDAKYQKNYKKSVDGILNRDVMPNANRGIIGGISQTFSKWKSSTAIQKVMGFASNALSAVGLGTAGGLAGGAIGNLLDSSGITGSLLGNIGGFALGGGAFGLPVALVGGAIGLVKSIFEVDGIIKEQKKKQLQAVKDEVDSGKYIQKFTASANLSTKSLDKLNAQASKLAAEFMEANPTGSIAEMLKYIQEGNETTEGIRASFEAYAAEDQINYEKLFELYQKGDISGGNAFAASLKNIGYSSAQLLSGMLGQAVKAGYDQNAINEMILKLGTIQGPNNEDLTTKYIASLTGTNFDTMRNNLQSYYVNGIAMEAVADLQNLTERQKRTLAKQMGKTLAYIVTDSIDELTDEDKLSMSTILGKANITGGKLGLWLSENFGITGETAQRLGLDIYTEAWSDQSIKAKDNISNAIADIYSKSKKAQTDLENLAKAIHGLGYTAREEIERINNILAEFRRSVEDFQDKLKQEQNNNKLSPTLPDWDKGNDLLHKAAGGDIRGVDTIPAMLQPGEFVVRRSAASKVGLTALNALNTGNLGYFARALGRQNIYGDYSGARTWNNTSNDNRKSVRNIVKVYNNSKGARLNRYYSLANRLA